MQQKMVCTLNCIRRCELDKRNTRKMSVASKCLCVSLFDIINAIEITYGVGAKNMFGSSFELKQV